MIEYSRQYFGFVGTARNVVSLYRLRSSGQDLSYRKLWTLRKESHFAITQSVFNQSITKVTDIFLEKLVSLQPFQSQPSSVILEKTLTFSCGNQEYNTNSELTRIMLEISVYECYNQGKSSRHTCLKWVLLTNI